MADFSISGNMKIKTLKDNFKDQFGSTIRVYNGVKFASDSDTVGKIAKKSVKRGEDVSANGRTLVGNFEKQMNKILIKGQWYASWAIPCDDKSFSDYPIYFNMNNQLYAQALKKFGEYIPCPQ